MDGNVALRKWHEDNKYLLSMVRGNYPALVIFADKWGDAKLTDDEWDALKKGEFKKPQGKDKEADRIQNPNRVWVHELLLGVQMGDRFKLLQHNVWDDPAKNAEKGEDPFLALLDKLTPNTVLLLKGASVNESKGTINMPKGAVIEPYSVDNTTNAKKALEIWSNLSGKDFAQASKTPNNAGVYKAFVASLKIHKKKDSVRETMFVSLGTAEKKDIAKMSLDEQKAYFQTVEFAYFPTGTDTFTHDERHYKGQYEGKVCNVCAKVWPEKKDGQYTGELKGKLYMF
jgi:hypothetical protein